jgi:hypothetical protein
MYHCVEKVDSVYRKTNFSINETSDFEVEPALGISLVGSTLGVTSRPDAVMIIRSSNNFSHISRVESAREEDVRLSGLAEVESSALGD